MHRAVLAVLAGQRVPPARLEAPLAAGRVLRVRADSTASSRWSRGRIAFHFCHSNNP